VGKKGKQRRKYGTDTHHVFPRSQYPQLRNEPWNQVTVNARQHALYHQLFSNRNPEEILDFLLANFWNGMIFLPRRIK